MEGWVLYLPDTMFGKFFEQSRSGLRFTVNEKNPLGALGDSFGVLQQERLPGVGRIAADGDDLCLADVFFAKDSHSFFLLS